MAPHGIRIVDLGATPEPVRREAAVLLVEHFDEPRGWPGLALARDEVERVLRDGFALAALDAPAAPDGDLLLGWIGGLPEYGGRVWELHPMVVRQERRRGGVGRALVGAFEAAVAGHGGLTITLGTDDDSGMTSLAGTDLYDDVPGHIARLRDLGRGHPFLFYRRLGFVVTGVMPDANGPGLPDIYMSKPVRRTAAPAPTKSRFP